jgi:hypothetical protein
MLEAGRPRCRGHDPEEPRVKIDLKQQIAGYRASAGRFDVVDVPPLQYLMIDGHGDPNSSAAYRDAVTSIFPLAYKVKFASRKEMGRDYVVMPLEGLWWADAVSPDDDGWSAFTTARDKSRWSWTLLNLVPDWVSPELVESARAAAAAGDAPLVGQVRLERLEEGRCLQTLHVGPYDDEGSVLEALHHDQLPARGLRPTGKHHEIYLSDPRRTDPAKLRTILRQPVAAVVG